MAVRRTSVEELKELLAGLAVPEGGVLMVHSSVFSLGIVEGGLGGLERALAETIGPEGTLVVPTFTYSFRKGEVFDVRRTPSPKVLGAFCEYMRTRPGAVRSEDPLFSMAAVGPRAGELMRRESRRCFGRGSIYEKLFAADMLLLALGITYDTGISAFMHLEHLAGVDYRYDQEMSGTTIGADGQARADSAVHFVRNVEKYPRGRRNRIPFGMGMEAAGVARAVEFGSGRHVALPGKLFEEYTLERLAREPHAMFMEGFDDHG